MVEIIAELSGNHGGFFNKMLDMIGAAAECGCDYAKFQFYRPEDMPDRHEGDNEAMYRKLMVPDDWLPDLYDAAGDAGIGLFASIFDACMLAPLLQFDIPYIKIASPESTRLSPKTYEEILEAIPRDVGIIISSGSLDAVDMWVKRVSDPRIIRMFCPPGHPTEISDSIYRDSWEYGALSLSDHTGDTRFPISFMDYWEKNNCKVKMIEKHFKIDENCIDAAFSANPQTMKRLRKLAHNR